MNDQNIENEIQAKGLNAPRVTPADVESEITGEFYFTGREGVLGMLAALMTEQGRKNLLLQEGA